MSIAITRTRSGRKARLRLGLAVAAGLALVPGGEALALCVNPIQDGSFEAQRTGSVSRPWFAEGRAGIDVGRRLSQSGANNAWARNTTGWNAIRQRVRLSAGKPYTLKAFVRTSAHVRDGYFGFRWASQRPVSERRFGASAGYRELRVTFRPPRSGDYFVFAGFWAPGQDAWIQVDNVRLEFPCNDVVLNPVDD